MVCEGQKNSLQQPGTETQKYIKLMKSETMFERGRGLGDKQGKILWPLICTVYFQKDPCDYLSIYLPPFPSYFSQIALVWILALTGGKEKNS